MCRVEGQIYKNGERFSTKDCENICTCHADSSGGGLGCRPLCPPVYVKCPPPGKIKVYYEYQPGRGAECQCKKEVCELSTA